MSLRLLVMAAAVCVVVDGSAGNAGSLVNAVTGVAEAPIGHLQPRARHFAPGSVREQIEQRQMSSFDAEQQKLDEQFDKSLNICRCQ